MESAIYAVDFLYKFHIKIECNNIGIIQRLDYIKDLGADLIWICPIYKSPNDV